MGRDTKNVVPLPAKNMVQLEFAELNRVYCVCSLVFSSSFMIVTRSSGLTGFPR